MSPYARFIFYWVNLAFFDCFCPMASRSGLFPTFYKIENPAGAELTAPARRRHPATDEAAFRSGRDAKDARPGFGRISAARAPARGRTLFRGGRVPKSWCFTTGMSWIFDDTWRRYPDAVVPGRLVGSRSTNRNSVRRAIRTMLGRSVPFE